VLQVNYKIVYSIATISPHKVALAWKSQYKITQLIVTLDIEGNIILLYQEKESIVKALPINQPNLSYHNGKGFSSNSQLMLQVLCEPSPW
jgi:hypothetical protein